jgi:hypothetical protein
VLGWLLAIPLAALLGDPQMGRKAEKARLFLVPAELFPGAEVRALRRLGEGGSLSLTKSSEKELHRQIWRTPDAELPPAWRVLLAQLEICARR